MMLAHHARRRWLASCAVGALAGLAAPASAEAVTADAAAASASDEAAADESAAAAAEEEQPKDPATQPNTIIVYGRGEKRIGQAGAASEGGVAGADIAVRPFLRPGELLESTPGLIATQHSGGGKANQFFLRGFNLDHGTDYALSIDDFPVNFRTHGHGQGYLDVQGLIPEIVKRVDYRKGPYRVDAGDFAFVGASVITTNDKMEPFALAETGSYGYQRYVAGGSVPLAGGDLLVVGQAKFNDGPWQLPEDFDAYSTFLKYSRPVGDGEFQVSLNTYDSSWAPTEQIPERAVGTALCADRFCSLDKTLRGRTEREVLTAGYKSDTWRITGYVQHYDWSLLNNFTFFLDDPVNGDQRRQYEKRWTYGGRLEHTFTLRDNLTLRAGGEGRIDNIGPIGLDATKAGQFLYTYASFMADESSLGVYAEAIWKPIQRLMVIGGLRQDFYHFKTTPLAGASWGGTVDANLLTPKIGANYEIAPGIALYANWGQGFHSNDARGVTNPVSPAPGLVRGEFHEAGGRFERGGFILTGVYWWSSIDSELIFVGDSGAVEPSDPGRRRGYELTGFWKPNNWLALDAVWTGSHSRFVGLPEGQNYVPGALESSGELGASAIFPSWNVSGRLRYLGPHALIEDNSQRGEPTTLVNLRAAWTPQKLLGGFELFAELLNAFDNKSDDIDYYYATRLPGEPPEGIEGRNSRIVEPRQVRVGLKKVF
jgi:outer membrane receptor protein involved in Fe transport